MAEDIAKEFRIVMYAVKVYGRGALFEMLYETRAPVEIKKTYPKMLWGRLARSRSDGWTVKEKKSL